MREIKFRFWKENTKEMLTMKQALEYLVNVTDLISGNYDNFKPLQYIGLKDKNGIEIYRGDIVIYEEGEYSFTAVIGWAHYEYCFEVEKPFRDSYSFDDWHDNGTLDVEVIGNIYENPNWREEK